jgi:hypothetical protein
MRDGDELTINQKRLMREMNQYAEDIGDPVRFSSEDIGSKFSDANAKTLLNNKTFEAMYEDNVKKPKKIGHPGTLRMSKFLDDFKEDRKKKSTKSKTTRKKKTKGCGCK